MEKIEIGDYFLFFSKKSGVKNIRLRFDKQGNLHLSAPWYCSKQKALDFAKQNMNWIETQMQKQVPLHRFSNHEAVSILGITYEIYYDLNHKGGVLIQNNQLIVGGDEVFIHRRVCDFAKRQLYAYIQKKALELALLIDEKPHKITLRDTSSRWGSCSSKKDLNFCWKLVFAPLFVIDYIIAHEVSHLKEMNHGPNFWATVALLGVEQAQAQIWLRRHGREIQAIS